MKQRLSTLLPTLLTSLLLFFFLSVGTASADFRDTFTDTNGTALTTHNANYSIQSGTAVTIQSNSITPNTGEVLISNNDFIDGCMSMDWTDNGTNTNMNIRYNNGGGGETFYGFIHYSQNWLLYRRDPNLGTIASGTFDFSGTHTFKLCAIGSAISVTRDGSAFASGTDTVLAGSGAQRFYAEGVTMDNLLIER
jgi:hypothetical protein